jgi:two-component system cell cycle sensor histidine kinase/response regulator CckA
VEISAEAGPDLLDPAAAARWLAFPPSGVWATDCDLRITLAMGAAFPCAGLDASTMVGARLSDMPQASAEMRDAHRVAAVSGVSTSYESVVGERIWEVRVSAVRRADGSVSGTIGTGTDVTRRKELALLGRRERDLASEDAATADARGALEDSEARFRSAFDDAPIGMVLVDLSATIIRGNDAFAEFLGYRRDELVGLDIHDLTHPDDDDLTRATLTAMAAGEEQAAFDKRYVRKDGTVVWGHVVATPIGSRNGSVLSFVSHIEDITELRRLQQELAQIDAMYRAVLDNSPDLILVGSPDGTIWLSSNSVERILGYSPDDLVGLNYSELIHPDDRAAAATALASLRTGEQREPMVPIRVRVRHKDGSERLLEGAAAAAGQDGGVPGRLIVTNARDVTTQVRLEEELRQSQKLEALGGLVAGVAHDFNNMLLVIRGWAEMLTKHVDPDRADLAGELRAIIGAADRAAALTHQLLAFSHRRAAKREVLDLRDVVSGMAALLARLIGENVTLTVAVPDEPAWINADRSQVEQVVANLTINGRDAIRSHGNLSIDAQLDRDRGEVRLVVTDDGVGMDGPTAARAFEPFFTTKGEHGTGLGLSTVRDIVTEIGGEVAVVSVPGSGATFTVCLPLAAAPVPDDAAEKNVSRRGGGERILLVEDEAIVRDIVARLLRNGGYEVIEAANGDEALAYADGEPGSVDLLLTDVVLTGEDGRGVAQKLVTHQPHAVVIFMSGYPASGDDPGTFLRKPFGGVELLQAVRAALDAPRARTASQAPNPV